MQNHYNLVYREEEREMMPTLKVGAITSMKTSIAAGCPSRFFFLILFSSSLSPIPLIPSTLALVPSRGPRSHAVLSHAPWEEDAPSALTTICA